MTGLLTLWNRVGGVLSSGFVLGLVNLSWFLFLSLAGRTLSAADFGRLALLPTFVNLVVSFSDLGLSPATFRRLKRSDASDLELREVGRLGLLIPLPLALFLGALAPWLYGLDVRLSMAVSVASASLVITRLVSMGVLRAVGRTALAALLQRGNRLLILPMALPLFFHNSGLENWALVYPLSCIPLLIWSLYFARMHVRGRAPREFSMKLRTEMKPGLIFWVLSWMQIAMIELDRLLIAGLADFEQLGLYYAIVNIMAGFQLLQTALALSLPAEMVAATRGALRRATLKAFLFSVVFALIYLMVGPLLLDLAYGGRFSEGRDLIVPFIFLGVLRSVFMGPSSKILLGAGFPILRKLLGITLLFAVLQLLAVLVGFGWNGLEGVVWSLAVVALLRLIAVYWLADHEDTDSRKKVLFLGSYGTGNHGDDALLSAAESLIDKRLSEVRKVAISRQPGLTTLQGMSVFYYGKRSPWKVLRSLMRELVQSKALVLGGGGQLNDHYPGNLVYFAIPTLLARLLGCKVLILGLGVGPFRNRLRRALASWILARGDVLTVRDETSFCKLLGAARRRAKVAPDLAWCLPKATPVSSEPAILLSLRPWEDWNEDEVIRHVLELIARLPAELPVGLIAMDDRMDRSILKRVESELAGIRECRWLKIENESPGVHFSPVQYVIAMRYHAALFAARAKARIHIIAYDDKLKSLSKTLGLDSVWTPDMEMPVRAFDRPQEDALEGLVEDSKIHEEVVLECLRES